jgi:cobalamin biosynthesis Mg chelatase CobN
MKKLILLFLAFSFLSCSTRKAEVQKKEESVSVLKQNDIKKTELEKIQADILTISSRQDINLSPRDPEKEMKIVYGNDTLVATNADINISSKQESEKDESQTTRDTSQSDKSSEASQTDKSEKLKNTDRQSASWGLNLGIIFGIIVIIIVGYIHFRTKK